MFKKALSLAIPIVAIVGAGLWIYRSQSGGFKDVDFGIYEVLGAAGAEEVSRIVPAKTAVAVVAPDTKDSPNMVLDAQLKSLQQGLKKKGLPVGTIFRFKLAPQERMATGGAIPVEQFLKMLRAESAGAVVLFCAFPQLSAQELESLKKSGKKFVVISGYLPGYRQLIETGVVQRAIVPRSDGASDKPSATAQERFESQFQVLAAENAGNRH